MVFPYGVLNFHLHLLGKMIKTDWSISSAKDKVGNKIFIGLILELTGANENRYDEIQSQIML